MHEVRTRLKRSRAALALIRGRVGKVADRDDARLRDAARRLARPRDLAVQATRFACSGPAFRSSFHPIWSAASRGSSDRCAAPSCRRRSNASSGAPRGRCGGCGDGPRRVAGRARPARGGGRGDRDVPQGEAGATRRARAADGEAVPRLAQAGQSALLRAAHRRGSDSGAGNDPGPEGRPARGALGAGTRLRLREGHRGAAPALVRARERSAGGARAPRGGAHRARGGGPGAVRDRVRGARPRRPRAGGARLATLAPRPRQGRDAEGDQAARPTQTVQAA